MGAKIDFAVRQPLKFRRTLQLPVLATGLDIAAGQASAPVALVQRSVEAEGKLELRPLQVEAQLLVPDVALTAGGQRAQGGIAGPAAAALWVLFPPLRAVECRVQVQALQAIVLEGQLRALQPELALRCLERAGDIDPAIDLAAQLRPELGQA